MTHHELAIFGKMLLVGGAILALKHLAAQIYFHFKGCRSFRSAVVKIVELDELRLAGILLLVLIFVTVVVSLVDDLLQAG